MSRAPRILPRFALAIVAVAVVAAADPVSASASGDDADLDIVVESTGDQSNAITLPAPAAVGQTGQSTIAMNMDLGLEGGGMSTAFGVGLEMSMTTEVTEVLADGGYVAHTTLDSVEVSDLPEDSEEAEFPCVGMTGIELEQSFDAAGNSTSMEPVGSGLGSAESTCIEQLSSTQSQATVVYPDEPIGPGATWSADIVTENQGIEVPVTYHYTLTEVRDGRFTIQTTLDSDFDVEQDGIVGTGNMSGSGTSSGAVDNPLDSAASFTMALDMVSDIDGEDMTMTFNVDIEVVSVVPAS